MWKMQRWCLCGWKNQEISPLVSHSSHRGPMMLDLTRTIKLIRSKLALRQVIVSSYCAIVRESRTIPWCTQLTPLQVLEVLLRVDALARRRSGGWSGWRWSRGSCRRRGESDRRTKQAARRGGGRGSLDEASVAVVALLRSVGRISDLPLRVMTQSEQNAPLRRRRTISAPCSSPPRDPSLAPQASSCRALAQPPRSHPPGCHPAGLHHFPQQVWACRRLVLMRRTGWTR